MAVAQGEDSFFNILFEYFILNLGHGCVVTGPGKKRLKEWDGFGPTVKAELFNGSKSGIFASRPLSFLRQFLELGFRKPVQGQTVQESLDVVRHQPCLGDQPLSKWFFKLLGNQTRHGFRSCVNRSGNGGSHLSIALAQFPCTYVEGILL